MTTLTKDAIQLVKEAIEKCDAIEVPIAKAIKTEVLVELCTLALERLATMPRPIEEAPKDGSEILAFADDPNLAGRRYSGVAQWAEADPAFSTTVSGWFWPFAIRPTHFIPLSALESPKP